MVKAKELNESVGSVLTTAILNSAIKDSNFKFDFKGHIELWDWLANNPGRTKYAYFLNIYTGYDTPKCHCFACEFSHKVVKYIREHYGKKFIDYIDSSIYYVDCFACPFSCDLTEYGCLDGIFDEWDGFTDDYYDDDDNEPISQRAILIRDFPIREDVEIPLN